jgi:hypothetical protein
MVKYAFSATPQSRGTSLASDVDKRSPSTHLVQSTCLELKSGTTSGAKTAFSPRAAMAFENAVVAVASFS